MNPGITDIKELLERKYEQFNVQEFIETDPISIPRRYEKREDVEIMGFFTATIAWGQRPTILRNGMLLGKMMEERPHDFVLHASEKELDRFKAFKHRTFNGEDTVHFIRALRDIYQKEGGLYGIFHQEVVDNGKRFIDSLGTLKDRFFSMPHPPRTQKHIADPRKGASAKRLNMFLRWMVRADNVDIGIWNDLGPHLLSCPLDTHSGKVARAWGLIERKQNDRKALDELDSHLRRMDPKDPAKYDLALYGTGVNEGYSISSSPLS